MTVATQDCIYCKLQDFGGEKIVENNTSVLIFCVTFFSKTSLFLRRIQKGIITNAFRSWSNVCCSCQVSVEIAYFFWTDFWKNLQISNFVKILSVGAELFDAEIQTDKQTRRN